jgi:hypothetical protein
MSEQARGEGDVRDGTSGTGAQAELVAASCRTIPS